jgi:hypothetical protein
MGETSHTAATAARPRQREDVAAAAVRVTVTHDLHQGRERTRAASRGVGGRGAAEASADGDSAPRGGRAGVAVESAPEPAPGVLVVRSNDCVIEWTLMSPRGG